MFNVHVPEQSVHNVMPCLETYSSSENDVRIRSLPHGILMYINAFFIQWESLHDCKDDITEYFGCAVHSVAELVKLRTIVFVFTSQ